MPPMRRRRGVGAGVVSPPGDQAIIHITTRSDQVEMLDRRDGVSKGKDTPYGGNTNDDVVERMERHQIALQRKRTANHRGTAVPIFTTLNGMRSYKTALRDGAHADRVHTRAYVKALEREISCPGVVATEFDPAAYPTVSKQHRSGRGAPEQQLRGMNATRIGGVCAITNNGPAMIHAGSAVMWELPIPKGNSKLEEQPVADKSYPYIQGQPSDVLLPIVKEAKPLSCEDFLDALVHSHPDDVMADSNLWFLAKKMTGTDDDRAALDALTNPDEDKLEKLKAEFAAFQCVVQDQARRVIGVATNTSFPGGQCDLKLR